MSESDEVPILPAKKQTQSTFPARSLPPRGKTSPQSETSSKGTKNASNAAPVDAREVKMATGKPSPPRQLAPAELAARDEARQRIAVRDQTPVPAQTVYSMVPSVAVEKGARQGPADTFVMHQSNPYISLYREFQAGQLTFAQLEEAIDVSILQDQAKLKEYEHKPQPTKPQELITAEADLYKKAHPDDLHDAMATLHKKLAALKPAVAHYLRTVGHIRSTNYGSLCFMRDMYERWKLRNAVYVARIQEVITTHELS